jgi:hypothetical protein
MEVLSWCTWHEGRTIAHSQGIEPGSTPSITGTHKAMRRPYVQRYFAEFSSASIDVTTCRVSSPHCLLPLQADN